jgi:hypothetical protein
MQLLKVAENPCRANSYCSLEAEMCAWRKLADFLDTYTDIDTDVDMDINSGREIPDSPHRNSPHDNLPHDNSPHDNLRHVYSPHGQLAP